MNTQYTRKAGCAIIQVAHPCFDRSTESDQARNGGFRPEPVANQLLYGMPELVALDRQQTRIAEGWPMKLAGEEAQRLYRALLAHPDADRLALVTMENGNRFAVPANQIDLASGCTSGSAVREALIVDARNLRARIARLIEQAGKIVGEFDES